MKHPEHFVPDKPIFWVIRQVEKTIEMSDKGKSQSGRAISEREKRAAKSNERQFNNPLRVFIEHKYPAIFSEYTELYYLMKQNHPKRKNLLKTPTFKEWKGQNSTHVIPAVIPQSEDILARAVRETINSEELPVQQEQQQIDDILDEMPVRETINSEELPAQQEQQGPQDIRLPGEGQQQGPQDIRQQIDDILDEMALDEDLADLLQEPNPVEDEGIGLNLLDKIYYDIEPFDFELEVE